eukprot:9892432-Lingulodinium_polyedra.AAC.1
MRWLLRVSTGFAHPLRHPLVRGALSLAHGPARFGPVAGAPSRTLSGGQRRRLGPGLRGTSK